MSRSGRPYKIRYLYSLFVFSYKVRSYDSECPILSPTGNNVVKISKRKVHSTSTYKTAHANGAK